MGILLGTVIVGTTTIGDIALSIAISVSLSAISAAIAGGGSNDIAAQKQNIRQAVGARTKCYVGQSAIFDLEKLS